MAADRDFTPEELAAFRGLAERGTPQCTIITANDLLRLVAMAERGATVAGIHAVLEALDPEARAAVFERLARLMAQVEDYLRRTHCPSDILRDGSDSPENGGTRDEHDPSAPWEEVNGYE